MTNPNDTQAPFDPFGAFSGLRETIMENWSKAMIDLVNSEEYARASGAMLDNYLAMSAPFQKALEKAMAQSLAQFNMPSRQEIITLAERLTNIEMKLDDLDAKLDELLRERAGSKQASPKPRQASGQSGAASTGAGKER